LDALTFRDVVKAIGYVLDSDCEPNMFAELAGRQDIWHQALEGWNVRESQQVLEWQAQVRAEAQVETKRGALERVFRARFKAAVPPDLQAAIRHLKGLDDLDRWLDAAATAESLDEFRATVAP
jgi:hypothetical protein